MPSNGLRAFQEFQLKLQTHASPCDLHALVLVIRASTDSNTAAWHFVDGYLFLLFRDIL